MIINRLLLIHAVVTAAAAVALVVAPAWIPAAVDIQLAPAAYLLCYLLGATELGLAYLSYYGSRLGPGVGQRLILKGFIVVHLATAALEVLAYQQGLSGKIWGNVALRVVVGALFYYFGLRERPGGQGANNKPDYDD